MCIRYTLLVIVMLLWESITWNKGIQDRKRGMFWKWDSRWLILLRKLGKKSKLRILI